MPLRIVPAHVAHSLSERQAELEFGRPCGDRFRFPGDARDAVCEYTVGDHIRAEFCRDREGTRMWRRRGDDVDGMIKPGSPPLAAGGLA